MVLGGVTPNIDLGGATPNMVLGGVTPNIDLGGATPNMVLGGVTPNIVLGGATPDINKELEEFEETKTENKDCFKRKDSNSIIIPLDEGDVPELKKDKEGLKTGSKVKKLKSKKKSKLGEKDIKPVKEKKIKKSHNVVDESKEKSIVDIDTKFMPLVDKSKKKRSNVKHHTEVSYQSPAQKSRENNDSVDQFQPPIEFLNLVNTQKKRSLLKNKEDVFGISKFGKGKISGDNSSMESDIKEAQDEVFNQGSEQHQSPLRKKEKKKTSVIVEVNDDSIFDINAKMSFDAKKNPVAVDFKPEFNTNFQAGGDMFNEKENGEAKGMFDNFMGGDSDFMKDSSLKLDLDVIVDFNELEGLDSDRSN